MSFVCKCLLALAAPFRKNVSDMSAMLATVAANTTRNDTSNIFSMLRRIKWKYIRRSTI